MKDNPPKDLNKEGENRVYHYCAINSSKCLNRYLCTCYKECERVIVYLLLEDVLHPKVVYTAYNTIVYICLGPKGPSLLSSPNPRAEINFPIRLQSKRKQTLSSLQATTKTKKAAKTKANKAAAGKSKGKAKRKKGSKAKSAMPPLEIVEINSSSSEEEDNIVAQRRVAKKMRQQRQKKVIDSSDDDSDFEFSD